MATLRGDGVVEWTRSLVDATWLRGGDGDHAADGRRHAAARGREMT